MVNPMTFEEFWRELTYDQTSVGIDDTKLRRLYDFLGPEHAYRVLTGRMLVSYETIRLGMLADIERLGKTIAELQGRLTEKNARIAELEQT